MSKRYALPIRLTIEPSLYLQWFTIAVYIIPLPIMWLMLDPIISAVLTFAVGCGLWGEYCRLIPSTQISPQIWINSEAQWVVSEKNKQYQLKLSGFIQLPDCFLVHFNQHSACYRLLICAHSNDADNYHRLKIFLNNHIEI